MRDEKTVWLIALLVVAAGAAALWYYRAGPTRVTPAPETPPPVAEQPAEPEPAGPRHPLPDGVDGEPKPELRPLPALDESDEYFKLELENLLGSGIGDALVPQRLVERLVATVDNLPRDRVSERIRPLHGLGEPFAVEEAQGDDAYILDEQSYRRYDGLVARFMAADLEAAVELYRRYYPLFQKAYVAQGYPDGYFNDRLVEVIDHLLATPDVEEPIRLERPHVLYEFADPELEALSGGQKLMLRLGPENRERVKARLKELRAMIVDTRAAAGNKKGS